MTDLLAQQAGTNVALTFSLPKETTDGEPFPRSPDVEIYKQWENFPGQPSAPSALAYSIPGTLLDAYLSEGRFHFSDPLRPEDFAGRKDKQLVYAVRASFSSRHLSQESNAASLRVFPPARPIASLSVRTSKEAITLTWTPPAVTVTGQPLLLLGGYRVYRAEVAPGAVAEAEKDPREAKLLSPLSLLGVTPSPKYRDATFAFGHTYLYAVRSVTQYPTASVESDESSPVVVMARNTFPPAAPKGLEAIVVRETNRAAAYVELTWEANTEQDLAGYNVYRAEAPGGVAKKINSFLLPVPLFRDISARPSVRYYYQVTAVSQAGVESARSREASATAPAGGNGG